MTGQLQSDATAIGLREFEALGSRAVVATADPDVIDDAAMILQDELVAIDRACSRFRTDSEVSAVHRRAGTTVEISPLLTDAIDTALRVAEDTDGTVDPTVGAAVIALGYDRDFAALATATGTSMGTATGTPTSAGSGLPPRPAPGWRCVDFDAEKRRVRVPSGVVLDLGATAKAFAADRAAARIAAHTGVGVLVNLGGDVAVAGSAPDGGWAVGIAPACTVAPADSDVVVAITEGGLASSGTAVRTWIRGDRRVHHIVDPRTGDNAESYWRLVSVAAPTCVAANAASTAAVVWGRSALERLSATGLPCRLVDSHGDVVVLGGWPVDATPGDTGVGHNGGC